MSGRIPQSFIDELLNRVDIVEVIDARVPLKKTGREYQACCPFHNEKTPSFTVSPNKAAASRRSTPSAATIIFRCWNAPTTSTAPSCASMRRRRAQWTT